MIGDDPKFCSTKLMVICRVISSMKGFDEFVSKSRKKQRKAEACSVLCAYEISEFSWLQGM